MVGSGFSYVKSLNFDVEKYPVPSYWNPLDKCSCLDLSNDRRQVELIGEGRCDREAAAVRANTFVPIQMGIFYYEIKVLSKGRDGYIGMGLCGPEVSLIRLPGWEPDSYGYHGDDGNAFNCTGIGKSYGPMYTVDDVVGCCFDMSREAVFFTKNGINLGDAFRISVHPSLQLFPTVGMRTTSEMLIANFGSNGPFIFDIEGYIKEQKFRLYSSILNQPSLVSATKEQFESLLLSYFIHNGYSDSATSFFGDISTNSSGGWLRTRIELETELRAVKNRREVTSLVTNGHIEKAVCTVKTTYPGLFIKDRDIYFKLMSCLFVEMVWEHVQTRVQESEYDRIFKFGQELQAEFSNDNKKYDSQLTALFSLLADPETLKTLDIRDHLHLTELSGELLASILLYEEKSPMSVCELTVRQIFVLIDELSAQGDPRASLINLRADFFS